MKDLWMVLTTVMFMAIAVVICIGLVLGIIGTAVIFFQKVWEHVNQPNENGIAGRSIYLDGVDTNNPITVVFDNKKHKNLIVYGNLEFLENNSFVRCAKCGEILAKSVEDKK